MESDISGKLKYFSELICCGQNLYYCEYNPALELVRTSCPGAQFIQGLLSLGDCRDYLLDYIGRGETKTLILQDAFDISWIAVFEVVGGQLCRIHTIGPAFNSDVSLSKIIAQIQSKKIPQAIYREFIEQLKNIPVIQLSTWFQLGLMLHYTVTGDKISLSAFSFQVPDRTEPTAVDTICVPKSKVWLAEEKALKMIEEGRLDYQEAFGSLSAFSSYATGTGLPIRSTKNAVISMNTLCVRAAIRGGLDVETAYHLGNTYLQSIEHAENISELTQINTAMYEDFVLRVHRCRAASGISKSIRACCSYIDLHIGEEISLKQLAGEAGYSEYYLTQKFKKEVGCTISDYIRSRKIEQAKLLLTAGKLSIQEISDQLGFCNHSYFTGTFRQLVGMTPGEYRNGKK